MCCGSKSTLRCTIPLFFFFNDPPTPEISPLSLPAALPICRARHPYRRYASPFLPACLSGAACGVERESGTARPDADSACLDCCPRDRRHGPQRRRDGGDRKSTRLNSSHQIISYAVFCLKKK